MVLRVGYVREHFSTPLLQFQDADQDKTFSLIECPSGTGQLISRLTKDEIDVAIALTDPLISGIANGSTAYKLVGSYVSTPLNWCPDNGYVMALKQGWPTEDLKFQINNDIRGLIDSVNDGSTSAFMWEWFTTKPFVDAGEARFIGSVPTPWPSWLIAAHPTRASPEALRSFMSSLSGYVRDFNSAPTAMDLTSRSLRQVWVPRGRHKVDSAPASRYSYSSIFSVLEKAGVVKAPEGGFDVAHFVATDIVNLT
ncbi:hypothetical protein K438DRAFT_2088772 [Mycena galopus ATCC 62051]|nr:hypothetical protein K438DRAFT_2088772 [Mycena galopus ATCC 62051]